ncbi:phosphoribosylaminoimidazolesuccinocarboxamide synthase [Paenibacillus sp. J2TS4]|uniref:phosphoribosylaminoimidazolesuccinocarboxamide synthase n=1 Tax=Paenibacillus sp. J2TS4 TaxID=2807194 RepID=UPI001BCEC3BE|nr:phosphoribosylaminoimidazolesuccinocarboxamide synthase [Paenibacillus sp. J2TS4]
MALATAVDYIEAPLVYKGKVRELYDLGEHYLIVVTDRISAFDYVLKPAVPSKGDVLNQLSKFWFGKTQSLHANHMIHTDVDLLSHFINEPDKLRNRVMVTRKAERIDMECVVRGYVTGGGWRDYVQTGEINGHRLPAGMRKNEQLPQPLFTPAAKNDVGHDENISTEQMKALIGGKLTEELMAASVRLYQYAHDFCKSKGIILADTKFEFGRIEGELILIDEVFTPDSSRYWAQEKVELDIEIDSMDKEPVRTYLASSGWDRNSEPPELPAEVVRATSERYKEIYSRLVLSS